jgi:hypothetical protein
MTDFARVDIGFQGGHVLTVRLADDAYSGLSKALGKGEGWHELRTQDSEVSVDLGQVVYVRLDTEDNRVGF